MKYIKVCKTKSSKINSYNIFKRIIFKKSIVGMILANIIRCKENKKYLKYLKMKGMVLNGFNDRGTICRKSS